MLFRLIVSLLLTIAITPQTPTDNPVLEPISRNKYFQSYYKAERVVNFVTRMLMVLYFLSHRIAQ